MLKPIRTKVVKIGNSRGIRIPRPILEQAGLSDEVELKVEGNRLVIHAVEHPRRDWEDRFAAMAESGDDHLIEGLIPTQWDEEDWIW